MLGSQMSASVASTSLTGTSRRVTAARKISLSEITPLITPDESTTGRRFTLNCRIETSAAPTASSGKQACTVLLIA
jgi:hypothetical protein